MEIHTAAPVPDNLLHAAMPNAGSPGKMPNVHALKRMIEPIDLSASCTLALERFLAEPTLYALPVVDETLLPQALLDRKTYVEFFSKPYSREIFARRTLHELLQSEGYPGEPPLLIEQYCSIEDAANIIIKAGMQHMLNGFIITADTHYAGVASGQALLDSITQRRQFELHYMAHYDALTGIPNRALFTDRLQQACLDARRNEKSVAVLFIDVDRFKQINDSLGHASGDLLLQKIVARLKTTARANDTLARLGGDEFVVLMENLNSSQPVDQLIERLMQAMQAPFDLQGHACTVSLSIGSAVFPRDDLQPGALLSKADSAMYEAKRQGRNGFRHYTEGMSMYRPSSMMLENNLRQAIADNALILHFQPQHDLHTHALRGVEALVRWPGPDGKLIPPSRFIPIAEESGLITMLGEWVLREACRTLAAWLAQGLNPLRMSINISALQLRHGRLIDTLSACLQEYRLDPRLLEIELTESMLMEGADEIMQILKTIKDLGVHLAIDDFGTGYSNLSYLHHFPIDSLKIDQSFVRGIDHIPVNAAITRAIIALADSLSLEVIAEGIETPAELALLRELNCKTGQGYLFAKPMSAQAALIYLHTAQSHTQPGPTTAHLQQLTVSAA